MSLVTIEVGHTESLSRHLTLIVGRLWPANAYLQETKHRLVRPVGSFTLLTSRISDRLIPYGRFGDRLMSPGGPDRAGWLVRRSEGLGRSQRNGRLRSRRRDRRIPAPIPTPDPNHDPGQLRATESRSGRQGDGPWLVVAHHAGACQVRSSLVAPRIRPSAPLPKSRYSTGRAAIVR